MKNIISKTTLLIVTVVVTVTMTLSSFKAKEGASLKLTRSESCTEWAGYGIQFRNCITDWGLRSYQFYNGYNFKVHFYFYFTYTDGTNSGNNGNIYLEGESYSDKGATDNSSGTNKKISAWSITKKERQNSNGNWVTF